MANGGEVVFDFKGNDKDLQKTTKSATNTLKSMGKAVTATMVAATAAVGAAFTKIITDSVKARGAVEQSIGGVKTIFKEGADDLIKNAQMAYRTAGISANKYMEQATSFGASLLQSLGGDTKKASEVANRAIIDMSDNANKMGTSMEMIQNAYQGFAKQNYTMLDNLKLGYGGTKTEMERLIKDASQMTDVQQKLGVTVDASSMSFGNIINAISVMQEKLGVAGATSEEAIGTLTGSLNMLKASWENFLAGMGGIDTVLESAKYAFENITRIVKEAIEYIVSDLSNSFPQMLKMGGELITKIMNGMQSNLPTILKTSVSIVKELLNKFISYLPQLFKTGLQFTGEMARGIAQMIPELTEKAVDCVLAIVEGLLDNIDLLIDAGIDLTIGIVTGLIEAMPRLIEKAPVIVEKLFLALVRTLPKLQQAGGKMIGELVVGILGSVVKLAETAPRMVSAIVRGIANLIGQFKNTGKNIVTGIWQGISGMGGWLASRVRDFAKNILNNMKSALGIHSPSTLFADIIGKNSALGIGVGFENEMKDVSKMMNASMLEFGDMFELSPTLNGTATSSSNVTVKVYNNMETDFMGNLVNNIRTYSNGSKNDYNYGMA